jgi:hypothetical protein
MNCQAVQNQILNLPDPRELTPALRAHVLACPACQAWARQAALLESLLERLPVPPAPGDKKEALLGELMQAEPSVQTLAPPEREAFVTVAVRFLRRNASYVGGLAAAVLVLVGVYWFATRPRNPHQPELVQQIQKDPLLEKIVAGNIALARAGDSPSRRIEVLGGQADTIATETRGMARIASGAELRQMAGWYDQVVRDGLVTQANQLPVTMNAGDKAQLLKPLAAKLAADARAAEDLSREAPQDAQSALRRMADTARAGERSLLTAAGGN